LWYNFYIEAAFYCCQKQEETAVYDTWEELETACRDCHECALCETRNNVVLGVGRRDAEVLFIGEGPGEQEDLKGEPFVGRAGQLLDKMLLAVGLDRSMIYIANMVKCRPPKNRDPLPEEQDKCIIWLRNQVKIMKPKIIVCLGRISGMRLIKPDLRITKEHGQWVERGGIYMMATLHPAALLRNPNQKPDAFQDFILLREKIREVCKNTNI
jgi:DNA polymerase